MDTQKEKLALNRDAASLANNLRYMGKGYHGASEIKFYLKGLKRELHNSEQFFLIKGLFYSFFNDPDYDGVRQKLVDEWNELQRKQNDNKG